MTQAHGQHEQDDAKNQPQQDTAAQKRPIQLTNDVIADTDLGEGPGNDLGTLSAEKARLIAQERKREQGIKHEADPEKAMSTDREQPMTRTDINVGE